MRRGIIVQQPSLVTGFCQAGADWGRLVMAGLSPLDLTYNTLNSNL
jgi:hypothetical protein